MYNFLRRVSGRLYRYSFWIYVYIHDILKFTIAIRAIEVNFNYS